MIVRVVRAVLHLNEAELRLDVVILHVRLLEDEHIVASRLFVLQSWLLPIHQNLATLNYKTDPLNSFAKDTHREMIEVEKP